MADLILGAKKTLTFPELKAWASGNEVGYGPIVDIGHTADGTAATFRYKSGPITPSQLRLINEGQVITISGKTEICRGEVFISEQLKWVAVFQ